VLTFRVSRRRPSCCGCGRPIRGEDDGDFADEGEAGEGEERVEEEGGTGQGDEGFGEAGAQAAALAGGGEDHSGRRDLHGRHI